MNYVINSLERSVESMLFRIIGYNDKVQKSRKIGMVAETIAQSVNLRLAPHAQLNIVTCTQSESSDVRADESCSASHEDSRSGHVCNGRNSWPCLPFVEVPSSEVAVVDIYA